MLKYDKYTYKVKEIRNKDKPRIIKRGNQENSYHIGGNVHKKLMAPKSHVHFVTRTGIPKTCKIRFELQKSLTR